MRDEYRRDAALRVKPLIALDSGRRILTR